MMGSKSSLASAAAQWARWRSAVILAVLLSVWFASSIASTLINKVLMAHFPYPVTISAIHMFSSVCVDWFIVVSRGLTLLPLRWDVFWQCLPVAATINFGKTLTYVSYGMVPASLTHTAKASSPVFSVMLTRLMFHKWPSMTTCLALIPLTLGVILSAITEINLVLVGFLAAVLAALANVLNSIYTKRAISHIACPDPIIFHMYTAATATVILMPWALVKDAPDFFAVRASNLAANTTTGNGYVAAQLILLSVSLHYLQNISSIYFLAQVSVLSHQVAQSLKRLVVIACSVFYFHTPVTVMNVVGMGLALIGFFAYSLTKHHQNQQSQSANTATAMKSQPPTPRRLSAELHGHRGHHHCHDHHHQHQHMNGAMAHSSLSPSNDNANIDHHVIDGYALARASELGSSHLLQSPASATMPVRHLNGSGSPSHSGQLTAMQLAPNGVSGSVRRRENGSASPDERQFLLSRDADDDDDDDDDDSVDSNRGSMSGGGHGHGLV